MLKIGFATPEQLWSCSLDEKHRVLESVSAAGLDHLFMADHVSFRDGSGTDGFVEMAALSQLHAKLGVMISIYLLPLRHPLPVARQIATLSAIAPGRFTLGVGIGGEDRHEIEVCGVDPATRGRRMNESLEVLRGLMGGQSFSYEGDFFAFDDAVIRPAPEPRVPILVGGRSNAALVRTARFGDGWIGTWCSVRRFREAETLIREEAARVGRIDTPWCHGYQPWVGVGDSREEARSRVKAGMESFYQVPFEMFEKYTPYGTPADVAEALAPYVAAGCSLMNLKVVAGEDAEAIAAAGEIAARLRACAA